MRRPSSSRLMRAAAAITSTVLLGSLAGCEARSYGSPTERPQAPRPAMPAPVVPIAPVKQLSSLDGLQGRVQEATEQAGAAGADLNVTILDRDTGVLTTNGRADNSIAVASVVKLFIADDLLLQVANGSTQLSPAERQLFDAMLRSSDDSAAETFWNRSGGSAIISRVTARYGLGATRPPGNGRWYNTTSTTNDLVRYYDMLIAGSGGLPPDQADIILADLAQSTPTAPDGMVPGGVYPQRFGIPEGLYAEPVAVKQGWMCCVSADWMHLSTGVIGTDRRFVMAISSMQATDAATARQTITDAVKAIFPGGRI
jgi:hypothetical protein